MSLKDLIFEHEEQPSKPVAKPAPLTQQQTYVPTPATYSSAPVGGTDSTGAYARLFSKTDFSQTDTGVALNTYMDSLKTVITDEKIRCKAAATLAMKDGTSKEKILATFDGLKITLQGEIDSFNQSATAQEDASITQKKEQIKQLSSQLGQLQAQISALGGEVSDSTAHIARVRNEFNTAVARRQRELEAERSHYAELLQ
jgi:hypothetical protein